MWNTMWYLSLQGGLHNTKLWETQDGNFSSRGFHSKEGSSSSNKMRAEMLGRKKPINVSGDGKKVEKRYSFFHITNKTILKKRKRRNFFGI